MLYDIVLSIILYYIIIVNYIIYRFDLVVCLFCKIDKCLCSFIAALGWTTAWFWIYRWLVEKPLAPAEKVARSTYSEIEWKPLASLNNAIKAGMIFSTWAICKIKLHAWEHNLCIYISPIIWSDTDHIYIYITVYSVYMCMYSTSYPYIYIYIYIKNVYENSQQTFFSMRCATRVPSPRAPLPLTFASRRPGCYRKFWKSKHCTGTGNFRKSIQVQVKYLTLRYY